MLGVISLGVSVGITMRLQLALAVLLGGLLAKKKLIFCGWALRGPLPSWFQRLSLMS